MASIPGGRADKQGNEFERLWTVRHVLELISGKHLSVRIECLGDDERARNSGSAGQTARARRISASAKMHPPASGQ